MSPANFSSVCIRQGRRLIVRQLLQRGVHKGSVQRVPVGLERARGDIDDYMEGIEKEAIQD